MVSRSDPGLSQEGGLRHADSQHWLAIEKVCDGKLDGLERTTRWDFRAGSIATERRFPGRRPRYPSP